MKKGLGVLCLFLIFFSMTASDERTAFKQNYGVLIGLSSENIEIAEGYAVLVIDADRYSKEDIGRLHRAGTSFIYSYLNIGSVETFRSGSSAFKNVILGRYENWPDEYWIDVSDSKWQAYITAKAAALAEKGVDGLFLDNADVWYVYPQPKIYRGLLTILQNLGQLGLPLILNGGDFFVSEALKNNELQGLLSGVNQENVFTAVDFDRHFFQKQDPTVTAYYQEYLSRCKRSGLQVYLTEYGCEAALSKTVAAYCKKNKFYCYISPSLELGGP